MNQKQNVKYTVFLLVAGALFMVASVYYAQAAHATPPPPNPRETTILEAVYGIPAITFCITGICSLVGGIIVGIFGGDLK